MNIRKYENLINRKGMKLLKRSKYNDYEIFISEGFCKGDNDDSSPHYKTMFGIAYDAEHVQLGEFFTTPILSGITSDDRMKATEKRAKEFVNNFKGISILKDE